MSIQTELTRLTNAKAAIKTAIEGKGVTVPEGTKLDALAALIESIEAGGGAVKYSYGSFTPSETTTLNRAYAIEHNSGFVPDVFIVTKSNSTFIQYSIRFAASLPYGLFKGEAINYSNYTSYVFGWGSSSYNKAYGIQTIGKETTSTVAYIRSNASDNKVVAGETYLWFAIGGLE